MMILLKMSLLFVLSMGSCSFMENVDNQPYCDMVCSTLSSKKNQHIVCQRKDVNCGPAAECENFERPQMTNSLRQRLLDKHNEVRNRVASGTETRGDQPRAANMRVLNYDLELEYIAQCLANTCNFDHDECRNTATYGVGQNLAVIFMSQVWDDIEDIAVELVEHWVNEVEHYDSSSVSNFRQSKYEQIGHYTQMVWAETEVLGCGVSTYTTNDMHTLLLVCNYGGKIYGGNVLGLPVYVEGEPCSMCPIDTTCETPQYKSLCGKMDWIDPSKSGAYKVTSSEYVFWIVLIFIFYFIF